MVELLTEEVNSVSGDVGHSLILWHQRLGHMSEKGGSRYYVTFIDDSTKKIWVYFLKQKLEVFNIFKKWKFIVENETRLKIKCLKSDKGGEYNSTEFFNYYAENGIRMLKTILETPQQNGFVERMSRTLNERASSMRIHAGLPKTFWVNVVSTTSYLINRGPSIPIWFKIPKEEWQSKDVRFSHLKLFGCVSYVHVKDADRGKLDPKARNCIFIGYRENDMGYPLGVHFNLTKEHSPKTDEDKAAMTKVPYASTVGSLMYEMVCIRPDISHVVGVASKFMSNLGRKHWEAVKWLLHYLKGTSKIALYFSKNDVVLEGYSDAGLGGCSDTRKSTTRFVFIVGGTTVSWMSQLQKSLALSTIEVEYMAISEASKEMIWLKNFLEELGKKRLFVMLLKKKHLKDRKIIIDANLYLVEVWRVNMVIDSAVEDEDLFMREMETPMKMKVLKTLICGRDWFQHKYNLNKSLKVKVCYFYMDFCLHLIKYLFLIYLLIYFFFLKVDEGHEEITLKI
uniref:Retrovirus-related Pol polyprotein from transposon TNT 1-94 n=1 Tax=Cajanus cajan TaxID=3821 RepID=A0A151QXU8_CAJCA|nr:Retrovirus-related Pol polyprotein from transposon TNT 1-94 [Cajanus cajan]